jgi:hypothetical protein
MVHDFLSVANQARLVRTPECKLLMGEKSCTAVFFPVAQLPSPVHNRSRAAIG